MAHIFISYSRKDREYARDLTQALRQHGFDVWIDDRIDYGTRWWRTIEEAIKNCGAFVVIMTPDSQNSEWVEREILLAQRRSKPIYPLLLKGEEFGLLITTQFVDVKNGQLPPEDFFHDLGLVVPPSAKTGAMVAPKAPEQSKIQPEGRNRLPLFAGLVLLLVVLAVGVIWALSDGNKDEKQANPTEIVLVTEDASETPSLTSTIAPSRTASPTQAIEATDTPTSTPELSGDIVEEIIVNVGDSGYVEKSYGAELNPFSSGGIGGTSVEVSTRTRTAVAEWRPTIQNSGIYLIEVWVPDIALALQDDYTKLNLNYEIHGLLNETGKTSVSFSPYKRADQWITLGSYGLAADPRMREWSRLQIQLLAAKCSLRVS